MTLGDSISDNPVMTPTLSPSVSIQSMKETSWGDVPLLDKTSNNYMAWSQHVACILRLSSGLDLSLNSSFPTPDPHLEPCTNHYWKINNSAVQAFLFMKCAPSKHPFIESCTSAEDIWLTLQKCHVHQGPMSQVTLIQEALAVCYLSSTPLLKRCSSYAISIATSGIWVPPLLRVFFASWCFLLCPLMTHFPLFTMWLSLAYPPLPMTTHILQLKSLLNLTMNNKHVLWPLLGLSPFLLRHMLPVACLWIPNNPFAPTARNLITHLSFASNQVAAWLAKPLQKLNKLVTLNVARRVRRSLPRALLATRLTLLMLMVRLMRSSDCLLLSLPLPLSTLPVSYRQITSNPLTPLSSILCVPLMSKNTCI